MFLIRGTFEEVCSINRSLSVGSPEKVPADIIGEGGGAVCTIRQELNHVIERLKAKDATRKFGGECYCVGDANHPRCYKSI